MHTLSFYLTFSDLGEIIFCAFVTHIIMDQLYKKHGARAYTLTYVIALFAMECWLLSYKIIGSAATILGILYYFVSQSSSQQIITASTHDNVHNFETNNWIETIFSLSIQAFHEHVSLVWIIDTEEQLHEILHAEIILNVYLVPKLSNIIISVVEPQTKVAVLWMNQNGYIIGINPYKEPTKKLPSLSDFTTWSKQKKIIIIQSYPQKRTYSIVHKGVVRDNLSSHHAYHMLKHILTAQPRSYIQELP